MRVHLKARASAWIAAVACATAVPAYAQGVIIDSETFGGLEARAIGPAAMSGRISALDAVAGDRLTIFVGAAGGGLWRSLDGGLVFKPVFDKYNQSIGAVTINPSNPKDVWVGTGETWVRNSVSPGDGVYRSTDGGDSWTRAGLEQTERIARIAVHPKDSTTVFVCATGHLSDDHPDRGVYRTKDGGKTWDKVLYVAPDVGCGDLAI
ncbi:MAG: glycosyl hydrolase, partial [Acidobacteria bacterium]|nr:glycosyl hydrolase [Acidobacteriota bacterium]